jgi:branched-chain amino acid transport system ATP-binding protein
MTGDLRLRDVGISFGGLRAVDGMSFTVGAGDVLGIIGPNGAGKSTLLNCINGIYRGTGEVWLGEVALHAMRPHRVAAEGVGRTLQSVEMFREITVRDYVLAAADGLAEHPGRLRGRGGRARLREREDRAAGLLGQLGLAEFGGRTMGSLPYGRRKLADIARALVAQPAVLLLDEPTAGTTAEDRAAVGEVIRGLGDSGLRVVVVDHDVSFIGANTNRVIAMTGGRFVCEGTAEEVFAHPVVQDAYLGAAT